MQGPGAPVREEIVFRSRQPLRGCHRLEEFSHASVDELHYTGGTIVDVDAQRLCDTLRNRFVALLLLQLHLTSQVVIWVHHPKNQVAVHHSGNLVPEIVTNGSRVGLCTVWSQLESLFQLVDPHIHPGSRAYAVHPNAWNVDDVPPDGHFSVN